MDLLIAVAALLAAILAVVPRERQLDLRLRVGFFDSSVAFIGFLIALSLEFYDFLRAHLHRLPETSRWPVGITPKNAMYLVILLVGGVLWFRIRFTHLSKRTIGGFRELAEELYWSESYGELFALLERHLTEIFRVYDSDFFFAKVRARLESVRQPSFEDFLEEIESESVRVKNRSRRLSVRLVRPLTPLLLKALPEYSQARLTARELVRGIFLTNRFLAALIQTRPYLGLKIIRLSRPSFERKDFQGLYIKELLGNPDSILYREMRNTLEMEGEQYVISESNPLVYFFFSDMKVAESEGVYKPVGDFMEAYLDDLGRNRDSDPNNQALADFEENGIWRSPLFVGIHFFDVMVRGALRQGIEWHMWLYYMQFVVERIVRNYKVADPLADPEAELPIRYSYLLYQIFSNMRDWVRSIEDLPPTQKNIELQSANIDYDENGNIPKCAILALSKSLYPVLQSDQVGMRLKKCLAGIVFGLYFELRTSGTLDGYASLLLRALAVGKKYQGDSLKYRLCLLDIFRAEQAEYFITQRRDYVSELGAALTN